MRACFFFIGESWCPMEQRISYSSLNEKFEDRERTAVLKEISIFKEKFLAELEARFEPRERKYLFCYSFQYLTETEVTDLIKSFLDADVTVENVSTATYGITCIL